MRVTRDAQHIPGWGRIMAKRVLRFATACLAACLFMVGIGTIAWAVDLNPNICNGRPYSDIVGYFDNPGQARLPLRCGDNTFGVNHIRARGHLDGSTANLIQTTLISGEQKDAGAKTSRLTR